MTVQFDDLADLIKSRRTSMLVADEREVSVGIITRLCELAQWAPNHKRTWPWRFALFTGDGRLRLGEGFVADMAERNIGDDAKRAKARTKYMRTPAVLVFGCADSDKPSLHDENRDAVAAGIQNVLLGATALGLATYWGSAPVIDSPRVLSLCGFESNTRIINVLYLGWAQGVPQSPTRPPLALSVIDS